MNCFDKAPTADAQAEMVAAVAVFGPPPNSVRTPMLSAQRVRELVAATSDRQTQVAAVTCCADPELLAEIIAAAVSPEVRSQDPAVDAIWVSRRSDPHDVLAAAFENPYLDARRRWELFDVLVAAERWELFDAGDAAARAFLAHGPFDVLRDRVDAGALPAAFTSELLEAALPHPELLMSVFASQPRSLDRAARLWGPCWLWDHPTVLTELVPVLSDTTVDNLFGIGQSGAANAPELVPSEVMAALASRLTSTQSKLFTWVIDHVDTLLDFDEGVEMVAAAYAVCAPTSRGWMRTIRAVVGSCDLAAVPTARLERFPATSEVVTELLARHQVVGAAAWRLVAAELAEVTGRRAGDVASDAVLIDA